MASASSQGASIDAPGRKSTAVTFFDLATETQHQVFGHCSRNDLTRLALVSHHFRDLAAAQLYRNFHIFFPDDGDSTFDSPIDSLADGLETFVSSDYDYARHLRNITLDTSSTGDRGEDAYKAYLYRASCGKFLNTLLLLTLRKAGTLETFKWNVRVELSRQVYTTLHQIRSLRNFHVRLQAGSSLFEQSSPLVLDYGTPVLHESTHWHPPPAIPPAISPGGALGVPSMLGPPPPLPYSAPAGMPPSLPLFSQVSPRKGKRKPLAARHPPTLSGFKKLRSLAVLDIDNLDCIPEIESCVKNSSLTLNKLQLSFSPGLASKSRKPPSHSDPEDDDLDDDEFPLPTVPPTGSSWDDEADPVKAFRAQEERKVQEGVLGRIFDVDTKAARKPQKDVQSKKEKEKDKNAADGDAASEPQSSARDFMDRLREVSAKLVQEVDDAAEDPAGSKADILDLIEKAATKYLESEEAKDQKKATGADGNSTDAKSKSAKSLGAADAPSSSAKTKFRSVAGGDAHPEDIDVEAPIVMEECDEEDAPEASDVAGSAEATGALERNTSFSMSPSTAELTSIDGVESVSYDAGELKNTREAHTNAVGDIAAQLERLEESCRNRREEVQSLRRNLISGHDGSNNIEKFVEETEKEIRSEQRHMLAIRAKLQSMEAATHQNTRHTVSEDRKSEEDGNISEYIRSTRGLPLRSFAVHLIPVKATVLKTAVDLGVLRRLTLLNVGNQASVWSMLSKENKVSPLPLRRIFTDNVSMSFLTCVAQLEQVEELLLLERSEKHKPVSFAPKTSTTIEQLRRLILKKHMPHMRRLMIKNDASTDWDLDEKTAILVCNRGQELEELAVSMNPHVLHVLMRKLSKLRNLHAFNLIYFRSNDNCPLIMREIRHFVIDNLSHCPELKLEWISVGDHRVERIVRGPFDDSSSEEEEDDSNAKEGKGKGKEKEHNEKAKTKKKKQSENKSKAMTNSVGLGGSGSAYPPLPLGSVWDDASESSDDEDTDGLAETEFEVHGGLRFSDVWGVRIFEKEVWGGRL